MVMLYENKPKTNSYCLVPIFNKKFYNTVLTGRLAVQVRFHFDNV